jgi:DNA primase large subunit
MERAELALYPFTSAASQYVGVLDFDLNRLINSRAFQSARLRGEERLIQSLTTGISKPSLTNTDEGRVLTELLSYPYARILVSCLNDSYLNRKYSHAEAEAAYSLLLEREDFFLREIGEEFGIHAKQHERGFHLHFADFLKYSTTLKAIEWKLINQRMVNGNVFVERKDFARLLQEAIKKSIHDSLPLKVPEKTCTDCSGALSRLKELLQQKKGDIESGQKGEVDSKLFPPCINYAINNVRTGVNLAHSMRFAMTSFLTGIGMTVDDIINMFNVSPDFDEEKTRYQIEHIAGSSGTKYTPPSCSTMKTYGNCHGADELCKRINHPLNYYRRKMWYKNKFKNPANTKEKNKEKKDTE